MTAKAKSSTAAPAKASEKRGTLRPQPIAIEPPEAPGPQLPPLDWETFVKDRAERLTTRNASLRDRKQREQVRAGYESLIRRDLKNWQALGNLYADALVSNDTPRHAQDALWEDVLDPLMDRVQINFSDPELLRVLFPVLCFLDKDGYSGGWCANAPGEAEGGE